MKNQDHKPIQTLRINEREKQALVRAIEQSCKRVDVERRRLRVSWIQHPLTLKLFLASGSFVEVEVMGRNLSQRGIALVHGRYVYPGTRCEITIPALDGARHACAGVVRHIRHVQGSIHEMGVTFDDPVDVSRFVVLSPEEETQNMLETTQDMPNDTTTEVTELASRVLVVDGFASHRKLYTHWLSSSGMDVSSASDAGSAQEHIDQAQFDLIVADVPPVTSGGIELIRKLRRSRFVAPILALSSDGSDQTRNDALAGGANDFLEKPVDAQTLTSHARKLMCLDNATQSLPIFSEFNADPEMQPLLVEFTRGFPACIQELRDASLQQDFDVIEKIAHSLKGSGSSYGFGIVSDSAKQVINQLDSEPVEIEGIKHAVNELLSILNRVRLY